jgi:hypothetical protein
MGKLSALAAPVTAGNGKLGRDGRRVADEMPVQTLSERQHLEEVDSFVHVLER